jgi:hypothetical protein
VISGRVLFAALCAANSQNCCGGTVVVKINGKETTYTPGVKIHKDFINSKVATPPIFFNRNQYKSVWKTYEQHYL